MGSRSKRPQSVRTEAARHRDIDPVHGLVRSDLTHDPLKTHEAAVALRRHSHLFAEGVTEPATTPSNLATHVGHCPDVRGVVEYLKRVVHGRMYGFSAPSPP